VNVNLEDMVQQRTVQIYEDNALVLYHDVTDLGHTDGHCLSVC
jgi:hypothetical protein